MNAESIKALAAQYAEIQRTHFTHLHAHPELSFQEYETQKYIQKVLTDCGIELVPDIHGTSVIGLLTGEKPGKRVAFRADIDALPVNEETSLSYKSTVPGVMHACGHDSHTATLLTFAQLLSEHKELVEGSVKFIFQSAEEKLPGGAKGLCEVDRVMDDVDEVYCYHCSSALPNGEIRIKPGAVSSCIAIYEVTVHGKGGHGSSPYNAINPVPIACQLATALNQIIPEKVNPAEICVLTVAYMNGGQYPNIITDKVTFGGNIRTFSNEVTADIFKHLRAYCKAFGEMNGCECEVTTTIGYPATMNDAEKVKNVEKAAALLGYNCESMAPRLGGEDFSYYLMEKPGAYFSLGNSAPECAATAAPHHNGLFEIDPNGMPVALEMELATYLQAIEA